MARAFVIFSDCLVCNDKLIIIPRLAKRQEILIFPRKAGNTGNSGELLVIPGNYWEIGPC